MLVESRLENSEAKRTITNIPVLSFIKFPSENFNTRIIYKLFHMLFCNTFRLLTGRSSTF